MKQTNEDDRKKEDLLEDPKHNPTIVYMSGSGLDTGHLPTFNQYWYAGRDNFITFDLPDLEDDNT